MSGRMEWTDTGDFAIVPDRATDSFAAVRAYLDPFRALGGKEDEEHKDDDLGDDLDEDDALEDADEHGEEDDALVDDDDDDELDDELIDLDDEYDHTDEDDRPHPGHRHDD